MNPIYHSSSNGAPHSNQQTTMNPVQPNGYSKPRLNNAPHISISSHGFPKNTTTQLNADAVDFDPFPRDLGPLTQPGQHGNVAPILIPNVAPNVTLNAPLNAAPNADLKSTPNSTSPKD